MIPTQACPCKTTYKSHCCRVLHYTKTTNAQAEKHERNTHQVYWSRNAVAAWPEWHRPHEDKEAEEGQQSCAASCSASPFLCVRLPGTRTRPSGWLRTRHRQPLNCNLPTVKMLSISTDLPSHRDNLEEQLTRLMSKFITPFESYVATFGVGPM